MKLRKLFFRHADPTPGTSGAAEAVMHAAPEVQPEPAGDGVPDNVVPLHVQPRQQAATALSGAPDAWPPVSRTAAAPQYRGLLDEPEIARFLSHNYWAFGRLHGMKLQSQHALELELDALTAAFQNVLRKVIAQRQAKLARGRHYRLETEGGSATLTAQLDLALANQKREIDELEQQVELAAQRMGWVLQTLNKFRLGFDQGVREHLEFHRIFG